MTNPDFGKFDERDAVDANMVIEEARIAYGDEDPQRLLNAVKESAQLTLGQKLEGVDNLNALFGLTDAGEIKRELVRNASHNVTHNPAANYPHLMRTRPGSIALRYIHVYIPPYYPPPPPPPRYD